ncbi:NAD(P)/FAD-dependent oxidoreductase [Thalassomonas sp. M1454]|uniref:NAD(P)/FAD-dependent oxidoreductase n=1 Tax=Thalassomonas sp. M1454 TaxID=2594477 RepID=UPI00117C01C2|nr:FAD-binding oxidoreductase [Thalassomonas sp. M1454]TRX57832.1 FAD-binding oxidoreductase [Thalassomonas sp. M1454]
MTAIHTNDYPESYYFSSVNNKTDYPTLTESIDVDVCIVGGGFSGVATALELAERGIKVAVLEANKIGWGASGRNGGQLIRGIGHDLEAFRKSIGQEGIDAITAMGVESVEIVTNRVKKYAIDCDLTMGYCDFANKSKHVKWLEESYQQLKQTNYPHAIKLLDKDQVQQNVIGSATALAGLEDMGSGHLHPLNLCLAEAKIASDLGAQLFANSKVIKIEKGETNVIHTEQGQVRAKKLVLTGNAYIEGLEPKLSGKILPAGSYVIATEPLSEEVHNKLLPGNHAVCDQRVALDYFRLSADKRLLFGGMCNYSGRDPKDIKDALYPKMLKVFPQLKGINIDYKWGGMIGIGANRLPQIGRLQTNVYYAQAYSGHGVNVTHMAAKLLAEAITNESSRIEYFNQVKHITFPGGKYLRSPLLALGMLYHKMFD